MDRSRLTIVFEVRDKDAAQVFWAAHVKGAAVHGLEPSILQWGDQLTKPAEIVQGVADLDAFSPNRAKVEKLISEAEQFLKQ